VLDGFERTVHHAPEIGLEQALHVFQRHLFVAAEDRHAGIVDPGIDAAEALDRAWPMRSTSARDCRRRPHRDRLRAARAQFGASWSSASPLRAASTSLAPASAAMRAVVRPMPLVAPVMTITCSCLL
jgi:hypothetical protein